MANNPYANKVIVNNNTIIDLTTDDVSRADVALGKTFHLPSGEQTTGTSAGSGFYNVTTTIDSDDKQHIHITDAGEESISTVTGEMLTAFIKTDGTLFAGSDIPVESIYKGQLIISTATRTTGCEMLGALGEYKLLKAVGDTIYLGY